jgi:tetratricopeptide (TPR) repeat protein
MLFGNFKVLMYKHFYLFIILINIGFIGVYGQDSLEYFNQKTKASYKDNQIDESKILFKQTKIYLKNKDNLEEYIYAHWDFFMLNPTEQRLILITDIGSKLWRLPKNNDEHIAYLHLLVNQGYHLKQFGAIYQSILAYENALNYYEINGIISYNIIDYCLKPLANNCTRIGDYQRADDILKRTLQVAIDTKNNFQISSTLNNLAISFHSQGKYKQAILILNQALNIQSITDIQKSRLHSEIAKNYYELNNYKKAIREVEYSSQIITSSSVVNPQIELRNRTTKTLCFIKLQQTNQALNEITKSILLAKKVYLKHDREIAKLYNLLAEVFIYKGDYPKALSSFQKSLQVILPEYQPKESHENPSSNLFYPENTIKEALDGRARVFTIMGDFENALKNYELSFYQEDILRTTYSSQFSKIIQESENRKRSEQVIDLCYQLYINTGDELYIEKAFQFAERSKAMVLLNELENKKNKNTYQSDSLIIREKDLLNQRATLSKDIQLAKTYENYPLSNLENLITSRNKISNDLQILKSHIQKKYPSITNDESTITVTKIYEKLITKNQMLIEFFIGTKQTYIFNLSYHNTISWRIIDNDSYQDSLYQLLTFYADDSGIKIVNQLGKFKELSRLVYKILLESDLKNNQSNVIIIPDSILSFLPFDALITGESETNNFENMPFLIFKNNLSYAFSTQILLYEKSKNKVSNNIIGFFPVFENTNRNLSKLPYTLDEAREISAYFSTQLFIHQEASKNQFIDVMKTATIIHLSTHANTTNVSQLASIEFWDETLYLTELYGYDIPADLVVLSACETGIGTLSKGEGIMSLARGFSYSGVKNLIVSLWKVNDKATSLLMGNFYRNMSQNKSFDSALRLSKINYLTNRNVSNIKKSPYYWAGFIPIKNTTTPFVINSPKNFNLISYFVLLLLLVLSYFLYFYLTKIATKITPAKK